MRHSTSDSDFDSFSQGLPRGFKDGKKLYLDVRKHMGIREERDMGEMTDFESLRDMYLTGKIWNIGDLVERMVLKVELSEKVQTILHTMIVKVKCIRCGCMR